MIWGLLLLISSLFLGLAFGTAIGARYFVPEGSGMAGPAIALGYGLMGALIAATLAGLLVWKGSMALVRPATLGAVSVAVLLTGFLIWRAVEMNNARNAKLGLNQPLPEPEPWTLGSRLPESDSKRSYRNIEVDARKWTFRYVAVGPEAAQCEGRLIGDEAKALSSQVASLLDRIESQPLPCTDSTEPPALFLTLKADADAASQELEASKTCLKNEPALANLAFTLRRLPIDAVSRAQVDCR